MIPAIITVTATLISPTTVTLVIVIVFICVVAVSDIRATTYGGSHFLLPFTNPLQTPLFQTISMLSYFLHTFFCIPALFRRDSCPGSLKLEEWRVWHDFGTVEYGFCVKKWSQQGYTSTEKVKKWVKARKQKNKSSQEGLQSKTESRQARFEVRVMKQPWQQNCIIVIKNSDKDNITMIQIVQQDNYNIRELIKVEFGVISAALFFILAVFCILHLCNFAFAILLPCLHSDALVQGYGPVLYFFEDSLGDLFKCCLYFEIVFRVYFNEIQPVILRQFIAFFECNCPFTFQIIFITHQENLHVRVAISFDLVQPTFNMRKCFPSCYVIDQQCADGTSIVRSRDGPKILLPRGVPNLQLNAFIFDGDSFCTKLNTDSDIMGRPGFILDELKDYA